MCQSRPFSRHDWLPGMVQIIKKVALQIFHFTIFLVRPFFADKTGTIPFARNTRSRLLSCSQAHSVINLNFTPISRKIGGRNTVRRNKAAGHSCAFHWHAQVETGFSVSTPIP